MTRKLHVVALMGASLLAIAVDGNARAALVVSTAASSNVNCSGGVCTATAANAVLNAHDLMVSLAHGNTTLVSGSTAQDIEFDTPVHWTSAQRLTLDSYHSITFTQPAISEGTGGVTINTNDGGTGGDFFFTGNGRVSFWNLASSLTINSVSYTLVGTISALASDVASSPSGKFAFANNYDASADGTYTHTPVSTTLSGTFEGLGNSIQHLSISSGRGLFFGITGSARDLTLIGEVLKLTSGGSINVGGFVSSNGGTVSGVNLTGGMVAVAGSATIGALVGYNSGTVERSHSSMRVSCRAFCYVGGLVGENSGGTVTLSDASALVTATNNSKAGGLVGFNSGGLVSLSSATGTVTAGNTGNAHNTGISTMVGGLIGDNEGQIKQSYATGAVIGGSGIRQPTYHVWVGGLAGNSAFIVQNSYAMGSVSVGDQGYAGGLFGASPLGISGTSTSYSTGAVSVTSGTSLIGGFIGDDTGSTAPTADNYWDLDTSGISDPSKGAGNVSNDPGITGLTTVQLQGGLPSGFDSSIWTESPSINSGLPYLVANPPQ